MVVMRLIQKIAMKTVKNEWWSKRLETWLSDAQWVEVCK